MGRSKEYSQQVRKKIVDFYKSGLSFGAISKQSQRPRAHVQTIIRKYKAFGTTETLQRSGRKSKLTTKDEQILVRKVELNPKTTKKDMVKELAMSDIKVSTSTIKRMLHKNGLKGYRYRKKPLLQDRHRKARLKFARDHQDKDQVFWRHILWSDETKIQFFGHNG